MAERRTDVFLVGAALLASMILIWFVTGKGMIAMAYGAGVLVLGVVAYVLSRPRAVSSAAEFALPDWSVTVTAIDRADCGVAITDKANRLVCANRTYVDWFGVDNSPPALALDMPTLERVARAARAAWRGRRRASLLFGERPGDRRLERPFRKPRHRH